MPYKLHINKVQHSMQVTLPPPLAVPLQVSVSLDPVTGIGLINIDLKGKNIISTDFILRNGIAEISYAPRINPLALVTAPLVGPLAIFATVLTKATFDISLDFNNRTISIGIRICPVAIATSACLNIGPVQFPLSIVLPLNVRPPIVDSLLAGWGDAKIMKYRVCRQPIDRPIATLINLLTLGKFDQARRDLNYDHYFHLYSELALLNPDGERNLILLEKNQRVNVIPNRSTADSYSMECLNVNSYFPGSLTLRQFIQNGERQGGADFYAYDASNNNCQNFQWELLVGNGLQSEELQNFVLQDVRSAITPFVAWFARGITDLAGRLETLFDFRFIKPKKRSRSV